MGAPPRQPERVPAAFQRFGAVGGALLLAGAQVVVAAGAPFLFVPFIACLALPVVPILFLAYAVGVAITVAGPIRDEEESGARFVGALGLGLASAAVSGLGAMLALASTHAHLLSMSRGHGPSELAEFLPALGCAALAFLLAAGGLLLRRAGPWIALGSAALITNLIPLSVAAMAIASRVFELPMSA